MEQCSSAFNNNNKNIEQKGFCKYEDVDMTNAMHIDS